MNHKNFYDLVIPKQLDYEESLLTSVLIQIHNIDTDGHRHIGIDMYI